MNFFTGIHEFVLVFKSVARKEKDPFTLLQPPQIQMHCELSNGLPPKGREGGGGELREDFTISLPVPATS